MANDDDDSGLLGGAREAFELVKEYARQETIAPLRRLGGYLAKGVAGSLLLGIGVISLAMAALRAMQTETGTALTGSWSWVPYLVVLAATAVIAALSVAMITRDRT